MSDKQKGVIALLLAAALTGSYGVFSHYIRFHIPLFYQMFLRCLLQLLIVTILYVVKDKKKPIAKKDIRWFVLRSACGFVNTIGLYIAFTRITIGTTYFLSFAASTICGYILGRSLFKERINGKSLLALGLSIAGLGLVYSVSFHASTIWYSVAAIIAGIVAPGWSVFSKRISKTYSNIQMNLVDTIVAVMLAFVASLVVHGQWVAIQFNSVWIAAFFLAIILFIAALLVVYGFRRVDAQTGTLLLLFEVVVGIILGYIFFNQTIPFRDIVGGVMILAAIFIRTFSSPPSSPVHNKLIIPRKPSSS